MNASDTRECLEYAEAPDPPASLEFLEMASCIMTAYGLSFPSNLKEALDLYVTLTSMVESFL